MTDIERDAENASDKVQAGAKAVGNKMVDTGKEAKTEYNKEKIKENLD